MNGDVLPGGNHREPPATVSPRSMAARTMPTRRQGGAFTAGVYEIEFEAGAYHRTAAPADTGTPFLDRVPVRFGISEPGANYHVPLLLSPFGYSTYRGS